MHATNNTLTAAIHGLERIRSAVHKAERATSRKRTPGREATLLELDDLSGWDATQLRIAGELDIDLSEIGMAASGRIDDLIDTWTKHGIHGAERAALND